MKGHVALSLIVTILALAAFCAAQTMTYQQGTILDIKERNVQSNVHKATDAPPPPGGVTYDVTVQLGDTVYVAQYQHNTDYVPSNWEVGKPVDMRVGPHKHRIYLKNVTGKEYALLIQSTRPATAPAPAAK
jgi:hypothetical protein